MASSGGSCCLVAPRDSQARRNTIEGDDNEQVVLISSAASGIGRGLAVAFAALNYRLVLVDERPDGLNETARLCTDKYPLDKQKSKKPLEFAVDLSSGDQIARSVIQSTITQLQRLDILINIAAYRVSSQFNQDSCIDLYHKTIAKNLHSTVYLSLAAYNWLKESKGSIVNVSSSLDDRPSKFMFAYCASKAAISMLTKCLANDFSPHVRVNCVSSGPIASTILDDMGIGCTEGNRGKASGLELNNNNNNNDDDDDIDNTNSNNNTNSKDSKRNPIMRGNQLKSDPSELSPACEHIQSMADAMRIGEPEKVAKMIIYLSSKDKVSFITGSRVLLDGGQTL